MGFAAKDEPNQMNGRDAFSSRDRQAPSWQRLSIQYLHANFGCRSSEGLEIAMQRQNDPGRM